MNLSHGVDKSMRKALIVLVAVAVVSLPAALFADGSGSAFGTLATAPAVGQGVGQFGVGLGLGSGVDSFTGTFRYGVSTYSDFSIKLGLSDPGGNTDTKFTIGADYKWQFWNLGPETTNPFDFSVGPMFEFASYENFSILQFGGFLLGSYPIAMGNNSTLSPYGRFNVRVESIKWDNIFFKDDKSNLELGLTVGTAWLMTPSVTLLGELQFDGNDGIFLGVNFDVM